MKFEEFCLVAIGDLRGPKMERWMYLDRFVNVISSHPQPNSSKEVDALPLGD